MRLVLVFLMVLQTAARADTSKLAKEDVPLQTKGTLRGKNKLCCGYPLAQDLGFALRFYWLTAEADYLNLDQSNVPRGGACAIPANRWTEIYTPEGFFLAHIPERFACSLRLEGSDVKEMPFGRGAGTRPLIPFKSVAVDTRVIQIGEPLYIPEFDGMHLPDGSIHDGCVRATDTGGGIKGRKMDFFVVTYGNFRFLLEELLNVSWITPHIMSPRCEYMRDL